MSKQGTKVKEQVGDESPRLLPLKLHMVGCATEKEMNDNVMATLERGYTPIMESIGKYKGKVSIVGAGPSLKYTHQDIRGDVIAINSAIGYLLDQGIVPKFAVIWDAAEICEQFAIPHPKITYLIGARCHPKVFERLKDCNVIVWYAGGDHNIFELMEEKGINEPLINGGSAGVTRGMYVAVALGYTSLHLFGADGCYRKGETHIKGSLVDEQDIMIAIGDNPPLFFRTTPQWCAQVNEFRDIYSLFSHPQINVKVKVHGEGMIPHMWKLMNEKRKKKLLWNKDGSAHPSNVLPLQPEVEEELNKQNEILPSTQPLEENRPC